MNSWRIDVRLQHNGAFIKYSEGTHSVEVWCGPLSARDEVMKIAGSKTWNEDFAWAAGRQLEILDRIADAVIGCGDPAWRKVVTETTAISIVWDREILVDGVARTATFREGPRSLSFQIREGRQKGVLVVIGPEESRWRPFGVDAPPPPRQIFARAAGDPYRQRRHDIVARVAYEVIRQVAPGCIPHYDESHPNDMEIHPPSSHGGDPT